MLKQKPKVIFVLTDDQGYGDLGCHGNAIIKTPHIDRLHSQSVRLTDFHVDPVCSPTRAALMTGRYATRVGVWETTSGRSLLRRGETTMAEVFASNGYITGIFGKWHLGNNYPFRPQDRGFHETLIHGGAGVGQTPDYWGNDYFDDTYFHNGVPKKCSGYCTDIWFDNAMQFIEMNKDRPFFCYIPTNAPHTPLNVDEKYSAPYEGIDNVPEPKFYGMIANIDENMGRLMAHLEELGIEDNTILIFMTDNGTANGVKLDRNGFVTTGYNAGMRGKKGTIYEGGHRVPCFIRWSGEGIGGGRDIDELTAHIDIFPTLIDLCGLEKPDNVEFDGTSLKPLLKDKERVCYDRTLVVQRQQRGDIPPEKWSASVMKKETRLVNGEELYDLKNDPEQRVSIADKRSEEVIKMRDVYEKWWKSVSEHFDEVQEIVIGSDKVNPVTLTGFDWHCFPTPWNQHHIRQGLKSNGYWAVEIESDAEYEFSLYRWPQEANLPVNFAPRGCKTLEITEARLQIGGLDLTKQVEQEEISITFKCALKKGSTRLQTWFTDQDGSSYGAYYVYVKKMN